MCSEVVTSSILIPVRHMMSGRLGARVVGKGFTMVYAPQNEEEFDVMKRIFVAGARYMAFGREIKS